MDHEAELTPEQKEFGKKLVALVVRSCCAAGCFWVAASSASAWFWAFGIACGIALVVMAIYRWRNPRSISAVNHHAPNPDAPS